eukprot:gene2644-2944_t
MVKNATCEPVDVWQVVLQSQAVRSSITTASSIQRLSGELNHAVKAHCRGRLDVHFSARSLDEVQKFCYWLQAGNWDMMSSLEVHLSPLHEESEIDRAVEMLGRVLQQGAGLKRLNLQSYRCHDAAGSSSRILRPISCSNRLQSMQLVVGVPHWAGACASRDEYAGAADSGLQLIRGAADPGSLQQTAAALGFSALKHLVCLHGLVIKAEDQLPASLLELRVARVAAVQPLLPLAQLQELEGLEPSMGHGSSNWGLEVVQSLAGLPLLSSLSLVGLPLGGAAAAGTMAGLRCAPRLRHLKLVNCGVCDATLWPVLARMTSLRALFIGSSSRAKSATSTIGDDLLPAVAALTQLQTLCLTGTAVSPAGEALLGTLPHLDSLYVGP